MKKIMTGSAAVWACLALAPAAPRAQSAIGQLGDAGSTIQKSIAEQRGLSSPPIRPAPPVPEDIFDGCTGVDQSPSRAGSLPLAVEKVQSCLDIHYPHGPNVRTRYSVMAFKAQVPHPFMAVMVDGIAIAVAGTPLASDPVFKNIAHSLGKRNRRLFGFVADLAPARIGPVDPPAANPDHVEYTCTEHLADGSVVESRQIDIVTRSVDKTSGPNALLYVRAPSLIAIPPYRYELLRKKLSGFDVYTLESAHYLFVATMPGAPRARLNFKDSTNYAECIVLADAQNPKL